MNMHANPDQLPNIEHIVKTGWEESNNENYHSYQQAVTFTFEGQ